MNAAQLHLALNHIPVVALPIVLLFLILSYRRKDEKGMQEALWMLFGVAMITVGVFLTGDPAYDQIKALTGIKESVVKAHDDAAEISLILMSLTGVVSVGALFFKPVKFRKMFRITVLVVGLLTVMSLLYTAHLGGLIRHPEISGVSTA